MRFGRAWINPLDQTIGVSIPDNQDWEYEISHELAVLHPMPSIDRLRYLAGRQGAYAYWTEPHAPDDCPFIDGDELIDAATDGEIVALGSTEEALELLRKRGS